MHYVELSVKNPVNLAVASATAAGASIKVLVADAKWTTTTVRLSSSRREAVEAALHILFSPAVAVMHSAAIKTGV